MSHTDITIFLLGLGVLLGAARVLGEVATKLGQPSVVGEIIAGVLLGPTVFGSIAPGLQQGLFPSEGSVAVAMGGLTTLAICLFLLVAGMEIDLSSVVKRGKSVVFVGGLGMIIPFVVGAGPALAAPEWFGATDEVSPWLFAAFFGTAMAITALPVIAKILMDLKLFQSDLAVTIIAAAILNDLAGWIIFAFILGFIGIGGGMHPAMTAVLTLGFAAFVLTIGRWAINRSLPWVQANSQWPAGVLAYAITLALLAAAFTEFIGVHAIFGAFLLGIAIGDSPHLRHRTRSIVEQFVGSIFAPIFFASIGLAANFATSFDPFLVFVVLAIATVGKVGGCWLGARLSGYDTRDSWAVGFGMNARGAMEIVLGLLALTAGVIDERLFVALVVMAVVTSATSGILMQRSFGKKKEVSFLAYASPQAFIADLNEDDGPGLRTGPSKAIMRVATATAAEVGLDPSAVVGQLTRHAKASAIGNGIALPHVRLGDIEKPIVGIGLAPLGIDFDAADDRKVSVIIVVVSPHDFPATHLGVLKSVAEAFANPDTAAQAAQNATTLTELKAFLKIGKSESEDKDESEGNGEMKPDGMSDHKPDDGGDELADDQTNTVTP